MTQLMTTLQLWFLHTRFELIVTLRPFRVSMLKVGYLVIFHHFSQVQSSCCCIAGGFAIGLGFGFGVQVVMKWLRRQGATSDQQVFLCLA